MIKRRLVVAYIKPGAMFALGRPSTNLKSWEPVIWAVQISLKQNTRETWEEHLSWGKQRGNACPPSIDKEMKHRKGQMEEAASEEPTSQALLPWNPCCLCAKAKWKSQLNYWSSGWLHRLHMNNGPLVPERNLLGRGWRVYPMNLSKVLTFTLFLILATMYWELIMNWTWYFSL